MILRPGQHEVCVGDDRLMLVMLVKVQYLMPSLRHRISSFASPQAAVSAIRVRPSGFEPTARTYLSVARTALIWRVKVFALPFN